MTTTQVLDDDDMTHILMRYARCTEVITAEYHPDDHGMPYVLYIDGGKHSGAEIHCMTEQSVTRLFNDIVAARKLGDDHEHPYLATV
jgi:hypothetical protein